MRSSLGDRSVHLLQAAGRTLIASTADEIFEGRLWQILGSAQDDRIFMILG